MSPSESRALSAAIDGLAQGVEWEFLSRWRFERLLDELAALLRDHLAARLATKPPPRPKLGCSLFYRLHGRCYVLGGSSTDRRQMDRTKRLYDLAEETARRSVTGRAILYRATTVLDDFQQAVGEKRYGINHVSKSCELPGLETRSYLAIPSFGPRQSQPPSLAELWRQDGGAAPPADLADGLLRMTFDQPDQAGQALTLLSPTVLRKTFRIIRKGRGSVVRNKDNHALAIADLNSDLLRYRHREYEGLDQLAFHLQTLYQDCECSIFLARNRETASGGVALFDLYLAATTAFTDSKQHRKFRQGFLELEERRHYTCAFDAEGRPLRALDSQGRPLPRDRAPQVAADHDDLPKTERAFYFPGRPIVKNDNLGSPRFPGEGEIANAHRFLAIAIPARDPRRHPYGVIRVVRYSARDFSPEEQHLAAAIAQGLTYWLDFFPRNDALAVTFSSGGVRERVLQNLFDIAGADARYTELLNAAEREFSWLLQKIFVAAEKVHVEHVFSGRSGALALLVKNDSGLDLIVKCNRKNDPWEHEDNEIWQEITRYRQFIEGKLELNHNIIYPELIRETLWLTGFATSFIYSRNSSRVSVSDACRSEQWRSNLAALSRSLTQVIEKLITDVWAWWYRPEQLGPMVEGELRAIRDELLADPLFAFLADVEKLDRRTLPELRGIDGFRSKFRRGTEMPPPSEIWTRFYEASNSVGRRASWRLTVTHGDTHGDNIFFDPASREIWIIDFARTGRRLDVFDLAMLESDLKFKQLSNLINKDEQLADHGFIQDFMSFEQTLSRQGCYESVSIPAAACDTPMDTVAKLVVDVRQLACQSLGRRGDFVDYKTALLLLAFKYMKLGGISRQRRLLPYLSARELLREGFGLPLG